MGANDRDHLSRMETEKDRVFNGRTYIAFRNYGDMVRKGSIAISWESDIVGGNVREVRNMDDGTSKFDALEVRHAVYMQFDEAALQAQRAGRRRFNTALQTVLEFSTVSEARHSEAKVAMRELKPTYMKDRS